MPDSPLPSPESMADLVRRGETIRREAERLVEDAFLAVADDPALGAAARDVAEFLARRERATREGRGDGRC